ncbi:hypothetical protein EDD17DRAFT_1894131 [Pisolithus thermaeus]|nr:hypothetical protein EDD17DRAFT_1894131 [Pisolithus thermaeus]
MQLHIYQSWYPWISDKGYTLCAQDVNLKSCTTSIVIAGEAASGNNGSRGAAGSSNPQRGSHRGTVTRATFAFVWWRGNVVSTKGDRAVTYSRQGAGNQDYSATNIRLGEPSLICCQATSEYERSPRRVKAHRPVTLTRLEWRTPDNAQFQSGNQGPHRLHLLSTTRASNTTEEVKKELAVYTVNAYRASTRKSCHSSSCRHAVDPGHPTGDIYGMLKVQGLDRSFLVLGTVNLKICNGDSSQ